MTDRLVIIRHDDNTFEVNEYTDNTVITGKCDAQSVTRDVEAWLQDIGAIPQPLRSALPGDNIREVGKV